MTFKDVLEILFFTMHPNQNMGKLLKLPICEACKGCFWVCENHLNQMWQHDECGGAGEPCPFCNKNGEKSLRGFETIIEVKQETLKNEY